jgi:DNA-binding response OmpR family regulator
MRWQQSVPAFRRTVLICDEDRAHTQALAVGLEQLGYVVEVVRSYAEAFAIACAHDLDALVVAPFLRDGSALVLPTALGIRKPPVTVLVTRMTERLSNVVARRVGFDVQLTKCVSAASLDRLIQAVVAGPRGDALAHRVRTSTRL